MRGWHLLAMLVFLPLVPAAAGDNLVLPSRHDVTSLSAPQVTVPLPPVPDQQIEVPPGPLDQGAAAADYVVVTGAETVAYVLTEVARTQVPAVTVTLPPPPSTDEDSDESADDDGAEGAWTAEPEDRVEDGIVQSFAAVPSPLRQAAEPVLAALDPLLADVGVDVSPAPASPDCAEPSTLTIAGFLKVLRQRDAACGEPPAQAPEDSVESASMPAVENAGDGSLARFLLVAALGAALLLLRGLFAAPLPRPIPA